MKNFLCYPGKHLLSISVFEVKRLEMTFQQLKNYVRPVWDDKLPEREEGRETEGEREREREGRGRKRERERLGKRGKGGGERERLRGGKGRKEGEGSGGKVGMYGISESENAV